MIKQQKYEDFLEALDENIYFNMKGCEHLKGSISIPKEWYYQILNWSGACTDSGESEDYYKNPRAMYVALDLIYRLLDSIKETKKRKVK